VLPPYDETISKNICPKYVKKINTERNLSSLTRSGIVHVSDTGIPLNSTPTGKYSESSYQKSQRSMKASQDVKLSNTPPKTVKFDDGIENLTETKKKVEALLHKPKSQWSPEDKKLLSIMRSLK
jgi:hypothetical protein